VRADRSRNGMQRWNRRGGVEDRWKSSHPWSCRESGDIVFVECPQRSVVAIQYHSARASGCSARGRSRHRSRTRRSMLVRPTHRARRCLLSGVCTTISANSMGGKPSQAILQRRHVDSTLNHSAICPLAPSGIRLIEHSARKGLGRTHGLRTCRAPTRRSSTTFYSHALLADFHGYDRHLCIVTDSDVNRVWAPIEPSQSKIAISLRAVASFADCDRTESRKIRSSSRASASALAARGSQLTELSRKNLLPSSFARSERCFPPSVRPELEGIGTTLSRARSATSRFAGRNGQEPKPRCRQRSSSCGAPLPPSDCV